MKIKELFKKILSNKIGKIASILVLAGIILAVLLFCVNNKQEVDTDYILMKLEKSSELTTAKLTYTGFSHFKDDGIPIINKADFLMVYDATARAGIDVKKVSISDDKLTKTIWLTIPKAEILDVNVDPETIKYYDEKFALFNVNSKEDANKAQALAEKLAKEELAHMGILQMANEQAEALLKGLLQETIPKGYKLDIKK